MLYLTCETFRLPLSPDRPIALTLAAPGAEVMEFTPRTLRITLTMDAVARAALGDIDDVHSAERFNATPRTARLEAEGCVIATGILSLEHVEQSVDGGWGTCHLLLTEPEPAWMSAARATMLRESAVAFDEVIGPQTIRESWTWEKPVRFLPVQRDTLLVDDGTLATAIASQRVLSVEDYHPFLHVATLLRAIVEGAGYTLVSDFVESEEFGQLHLSGAYPERDTALLHARLDFRATRSADIATTADHFGVVYADPHASLHSIGNLVDGASELNTGGVFGTDNGRSCFRPAAEVTLGFEYRLRYRTPYRIRSREELEGFNVVCLGEGVEHRFRLVNRFEDRRAQLTPGQNHLAVVFDHAAGSSYLLRSGGQTIASFAARSAPVTLPQTPLAALELWHKAAGAADYAPSTLDWALYDGHIAEAGETLVEVTLRSAPERVTPANPKYFDGIYFAGAWEGARLTLLAATTLRPLFAANPALGSRIRFDDVAAHAIRQSKFVEAIAHLFNLRITTDELLKQVHIAPCDALQRSPARVDWRELTDPAHPVLLEEPGAGLAHLTRYAYRTGDDSATRYNADHDTRFGQWTARIESSLARQAEASAENPLFTPTLSVAGGYPEAPAAQWMQVGERADYPADQHETLNFPAKIVRYLGLEPLPAGQLWGWPSHTARYPLAAFHLPGRLTLCFEDRDGAAGLHRYYDAQYEALNHSRRITAWLRLRPRHIEALDFGATFRVRIGGQEVDCRLERIEGWSPRGGSAKCTFISL